MGVSATHAGTATLKIGVEVADLGRLSGKRSRACAVNTYPDQSRSAFPRVLTNHIQSRQNSCFGAHAVFLDRHCWRGGTLAWMEGEASVTRRLHGELLFGTLSYFVSISMLIFFLIPTFPSCNGCGGSAAGKRFDNVC